MSLFQIRPLSTDSQPFEIEAADASIALNVIAARSIADAEVWEDSAYIFSVRMQGAPNSFWAIYQRESVPAEPVDLAPIPFPEVCSNG